MSTTATWLSTTDTDTGRESIVIVATQVRSISSSNPRFADVKAYCQAQRDRNEPLDADYVLGLVDAGPAVVEKLQSLTDRVSFKGNAIYFDGDPIESALTKHLVRMVQTDDDNLVGYAKFLENLASNPRKSSRNSLFEWVADRNLTITPEGEFIAYKGVRDADERLSLHSGHGFVDGVEYTNAQLPNPDGAVVTIPRSSVDENRDSGCSVGLHVGTRSYASDYGNVMLAVAVNPRDVVMVPRDGNGQKMRVCRYTVVGVNEAELTETTYVVRHGMPSAFDDDDEPYLCDCGEETFDGRLCADCEDSDRCQCGCGCFAELDEAGYCPDGCDEDE